MLNIHPQMLPVVQAALGADYFKGVMTPVRALRAIGETQQLREPLAANLTEVRASMQDPCTACQWPHLPLLHIWYPNSA